MTRTRTNISTTSSGDSRVRGTLWPGHRYPELISVVGDSPGPGDGMPFDVNHESWLGGKAYYPDDGWYWYDGTACAAITGRSGWLSQKLPLPDAPTDDEVAVMVRSRTNPSRPVVDLPIAIAELKDLPQLIRLAGRNVLQKAASANLSYQFGMAPLASDLAKLTTFQSFVSKRVERLTQLRDKGLRSTINIGSYSNSKKEGVSLNSFGYGWSEEIHFSTTQRVWGHIRWAPNSDHSMPKTDAEMRALAIKATLGLTVDASTVWELLPWSWLADWFSNVGDYFAAHRNIVPATPTAVQVMRETRVENTGPSKTWSDGQYNSGVTYRLVSKSRRLASGSLSAQLPFLDGRQLSILGSLAVLRR